MTTIKITLPSGLEVELRAPGGLGMYHLRGSLPIFLRASNGALKDGETTEIIERLNLARDAMLRYVVAPKLVEKWPEECAEGEVSTEALTDGDIGALIVALISLGGGGKEAQEALDPLSGTATA